MATNFMIAFPYLPVGKLMSIRPAADRNHSVLGK
jgi:hypothetical protein